MPSGTTTRDVATASSRQRPEDILAHTLSGTPHREGTDGWSPRGRRMFLVAMAVTGVLLVVAGLLVTKELAPSTGPTGQVNTGPGNGSPANLLQSHDEQPPPTSAPAASAALAIPIPPSPTSRSIGTSDTGGPGTTPTAAPQQPAPLSASKPTPTTAIPKAPTTTVPCGILGQTLQSAQLPVPCGAGTGLPLGGKG